MDTEAQTRTEEKENSVAEGGNPPLFLCVIIQVLCVIIHCGPG